MQYKTVKVRLLRGLGDPNYNGRDRMMLHIEMVISPALQTHGNK